MKIIAAKIILEPLNFSLLKAYAVNIPRKIHIIVTNVATIKVFFKALTMTYFPPPKTELSPNPRII